MKDFHVGHEVRGRIRFSRGGKPLTNQDADALQAYLEALPGVIKIKIFERTGDLVVYHQNAREAIMDKMEAFSWEDEINQLIIPGESGRALTAHYRDKIVGKILGRGLWWMLLPKSVRTAITLYKALPFIGAGVKALGQGKLNVQVLDATSIAAALGTKDFKTASTVIFLLQLGEILEEWTYRKSVDDLARSMALEITEVWRVGCDSREKVPMDRVVAGDRIAVEMGQIIPLDGSVKNGEAMVNQAALTGESIPVFKGEGATVYAGTVLEEGSLVIKVKKALGETRYEKIMTMIEDSGRLKSSVQGKAENVADHLVPATLGASALIWILTQNVTKTLSVLMVDFSCALKLSVPLAVLSAMREARNHHMTVKGGKFLEAIAKADTVVFDKTGTLTKAQPTVREVVAFGDYHADEMLRIAACLEEHFPHSMANAVVAAAKKKSLAHQEMHTQVEYVVAHGIASAIGDKRVVIGSRHFVFEDEGVTLTDADEKALEGLPTEDSHLFLGIDGLLAAAICIEDPIRSEVPEIIAGLKERGVDRIVMMTGDSDRTARAIARLAGVDEYDAEVLPEDKARFVEGEKAAGRCVIMIGDGINDSPALSAADVGIAISEGADIAREIADVTISQDDLYTLLVLKDLSDGLMKRIAGHYRFIVAFNLALIAGGISGVLLPSVAALLHNGSTLAISLHGMTKVLKK